MLSPCRGEAWKSRSSRLRALLARRIVFNHAEGETVERGQRVGLIKFGSRVDVVIPPRRRCGKEGRPRQGWFERTGGDARGGRRSAESKSSRTLSASARPDLEDGEPL